MVVATASGLTIGGGVAVTAIETVAGGDVL
jgi:hypothetical protein